MRLRSSLTTAFAIYSSTRRNLSGRSSNDFGHSQDIVPPVAKKMNSATSTSALGVGLGKGVADLVLKDYTGEAMGWFAGIRVPASLIVGASLGSLFTMSSRMKEKSKLSKAEYIAVQLYHCLILGAFILALNTVVVATASNVEVMQRDFNPMARSGYSLLKREFEYPFVTCRLGFLSALILFIKSILIRTIIEFDALKNDDKSLAVGLSLIAVALSSHLVSFVNDTVVCWDGLLSMIKSWMILLSKRAFDGNHPLQLLSLIFGSSGLFFFVKYILKEASTKLKGD